MNRLTRKLTDFLGSRLFWYVVLGFFVFEASWFVFSALYPQAFDEDFHLGVIRIYATHWSPFLTAHPEGADQFGAVVRDPSYFYHYLMSFPYRLLTQVTNSETAQVISLRIVNVAMFTYGLILFRRVMIRAHASRALTHVSLALFVLIPIVPQLAAHINYDNMLMILLPMLCLMVFNLTESFRERQVDVASLLGFIAICLFVSIVKYAALPFLAAAVVFLVIEGIRNFRGHFSLFFPAIGRSFKAMRRPLQITLLAVCLLGAVLFTQRYGVNMLTYKNPVPDCGKVLTVAQCNAYGPWGRDYYFEQIKPADFNASPISYMNQWLNGMWYRLFFAVSGPTNIYTNYRPLPVPSYTAIWVVLIGLLAVLVWWRKVFRGNSYLVFFSLLIVVYCAILWLDQYGMYKQTAQPVAINGRYLLPVLPLLAVILGRGFSVACRSMQLIQAKALLAGLSIVLFLHGGGLFTFILRSDSNWYWPSQPVRVINQGAQKVLSPITIEGSKY